MKTYPILRPDDSILAFEIRTPLFLAGIVRLLNSIEHVDAVSTNTLAEDRVYFSYKGEAAVISEPFSDNNRCWVGFQNPDASKRINLAPLQAAFTHHRWHHFFGNKAD